MEALFLVALLAALPPAEPPEIAPPPAFVEIRQVEHHTQEDVYILANIMWHEGRGIQSDTELDGVGWVPCNRADAGYGSLREVMTAPEQFAYVPDAVFDPADPVWQRCLRLAEDVLTRWSREKNGETDVGRVLPPEYLWYGGDGERNWFRDAYDGEYDVWDWSLESPYEVDGEIMEAQE